MEQYLCDNCFCSSRKDGRTFKKSQIMRCDYCGDRKYCCKACKLEDWNIGHDKVCESMLNSKMEKIELVCPFLTDGIVLSSEEMKARVGKAPKRSLKQFEKTNIEGKKKSELGKGSYGQVFLMRDMVTKNLVAIKIIHKKYVGDPTTLRRLTAEIEIHKSLVHENIIRMIDHFEDSNNIYIVMEYAARGSLFYYIRNKGKLSEQEAFYFFWQACNAIHFLHKHHLMHRDIKPENILITSQSQLKLCDFGCCAPCGSDERRTFCGTIEYMAPEMVKKDGHREKADVWSLGVLLYEMLHGDAPFRGRQESDTMSKILENNLSFASNVKEDARKLITALLQEDPRERPFIPEIFTFAWTKRMQAEFRIKDKVVSKKRMLNKNTSSQVSQPHLEEKKATKVHSVKEKTAEINPIKKETAEINPIKEETAEVNPVKKENILGTTKNDKESLLIKMVDSREVSEEIKNLEESKHQNEINNIISTETDQLQQNPESQLFPVRAIQITQYKNKQQ